MIRYNYKHSRHDTNPFIVGKLTASSVALHEGWRLGRAALEIASLIAVCPFVLNFMGSAFPHNTGTCTLAFTCVPCIQLMTSRRS